MKKTENMKEYQKEYWKTYKSRRRKLTKEENRIHYLKYKELGYFKSASKKYYEKNKEKFMEYYQKNKEKIRLRNAEKNIKYSSPSLGE